MDKQFNDADIIGEEFEAAVKELMRTRFYQGVAYANKEDESSMRRWTFLVIDARRELYKIHNKLLEEARQQRSKN